MISFLVNFIVISVVSANYELPVGEPRIECTVTKLLSNKEKFGDTAFPKLYESIYNDNLKSKLFIGGIELVKINPLQSFKAEKLEKIKIKYKKDEMELEIKGKPISRNGTLSINGKHVANITCH